MVVVVEEVVEVTVDLSVVVVVDNVEGKFNRRNCIEQKAVYSFSSL